MRNYIWKSSLASMIRKYLDIKHTAGFKYEHQERCLQHFDHYYYYSGYEAIAFTKESIENKMVSLLDAGKYCYYLFIKDSPFFMTLHNVLNVELYI